MVASLSCTTIRLSSEWAFDSCRLVEMLCMNARSACVRHVCLCLRHLRCCEKRNVCFSVFDAGDI